MASISPSPDSSPGTNLPNSTTSTSTPPPQPTPSASPPTATANPNATSDPPAPSNSQSNTSSPPANAPPPVVTSAPPPVSLSPPPPVPVLSPPVAPTSPPATPPPTSPPTLPAPPTSPPTLPAPPTSNSSSPPPQNPPPATSSPPPPTPNSSPPPTVVSPPPSKQPPPPNPSPPVAVSPPPKEASPPPPLPSVSPPPPADSPPPLSSNSPPPPLANPPETSPPPPTPTPPAVSRPTSPPPKGSPPTTTTPPSNGTQTLPSPPPPLPSSPTVPMSPPQFNSSGGQPPSLPMPTDNSTNSENANSAKSGGMNTGTTVVIVILASIFVLSLVGVAVWWSRKKKRQLTGYHAGHVMPSPFGSSPASDASHIKVYSSAPLMGSSSGSDIIYSPPESGGLGNSRSFFTYQELLTATDGFSAENLLGEGGFGCVYKGILADGREVAVKQLKIGGSQGEREFGAEVETISRIHHRHLVSLVGYCIFEHQRLLVYDFVPNDTLYYHLHGKDRPVMDWAIRVKVATGAARGISYLHEDCHPRIIHRDIKSSNILLDNNFDAQVSDFGLAKLALDFDTHVTTRVMGTFGYMAPEYASSGKLTEKSDVYSFGVVLLELITGRKPVDASQPLGDESLVEWARPLMSDALENRQFEELIDARLEKNYVESEVLRMIEAAAACVRHSAAKRPRMGQVVRALDAIGYSTDLTNGVRPGQSEVYNSAEQSAEIRMFRRMAFGTQDYDSDIFSRSSWEI